MEYEKCLVQIDEVLKYLSIEDKCKIPNEIKEAIKAQKDKNYVWKYDESKALNEQNLSRNTIAILSYLNMEYLLNDEQKELMKKIHKLNEEKLEKSKQEKYKTEDIFKQNNVKKTEKIEEVALTKVKRESFFDKIFNVLKKLFK